MSKAPHPAGRLAGPALAALLLALPAGAPAQTGDSFRDDFGGSPAVGVAPDPAPELAPTRPARPEGASDFIPDAPLRSIEELLEIQIDPDAPWLDEMFGDPGKLPDPEPLPDPVAGAPGVRPTPGAADLATAPAAAAATPALPAGWAWHEGRIATDRDSGAAAVRLALPAAFAPLDAETGGRLAPDPGEMVFADVDMEAMVRGVMTGQAAPHGRVLYLGLPSASEGLGFDENLSSPRFTMVDRGEITLAGGHVVNWLAGHEQQGPVRVWTVAFESVLPVAGDGHLAGMLGFYAEDPEFPELGRAILATLTLTADPTAAPAPPRAAAPATPDPTDTPPPRPATTTAPADTQLTTPAPQPVPAPPDADLRAEIALWERVRDSRDPAALRSYLDRWPDGHFAPLARLRLAALAPAAPGHDGAALSPAPAKDEPVASPGPALSPDGVWELSADGATRRGTLTLSRSAEGWRGHLNLDQGHDETLDTIGFDPASGQIGFTRRVAGVVQVYAGTLGSDGMAGSYTMDGRSYRWSASRAAAPPPDQPEQPEQPEQPDSDTLVADCRNRTPPGTISDPHGAVMACRLAVAQRPDAADLHAALARALRAAGSPAEALDHSRRAAELGDGPSLTTVALAYRLGEGVPQDDRQAVAWYLRAAEAGEGQAMNNLGFMQAQGLGGLPPDQPAAARWYLRAAEAGNPSAMGNLGERYRIGNGVARDLQLAEHWLRRGAEAGDRTSMTRLGALLGGGELGHRDQGAALVWFRRAADLGDGYGMAHLGRAHALGDGVATDPEQAAEWFDRAARQGAVAAVLPVLESLPRPTLRALQARMAGAGVYRGAIDGESGPQTRAAVSALGDLGP